MHAFDSVPEYPGLKSDRWIKLMVERNAMIDPFEEDQVREGVISYGLSSYGYDIRVSTDFKIFHNLTSGEVDPKNFDESLFIEMDVANKPKDEQFIRIPPNSFALARSVEYMRIPRNVTGVVLGKSTLARCGIHMNFTPLEASWEGWITIEISNTSPLPTRIYALEGIAQVLFFLSPDECEKSYKDKGGQYDKAQGIQLPKIVGL